MGSQDWKSTATGCFTTSHPPESVPGLVFSEPLETEGEPSRLIPDPDGRGVPPTTPGQPGRTSRGLTGSPTNKQPRHLPQQAPSLEAPCPVGGEPHPPGGSTQSDPREILLPPKASPAGTVGAPAAPDTPGTTKWHHKGSQH